MTNSKSIARLLLVVPLGLIVTLLLVGCYTWWRPYGSVAFVSWDSRSTQIPIPLVNQQRDATQIEENLQLVIEGSFDPDTVHAIDLTFFTSQTHPRVSAARIIQGFDCVMEAQAPAFSGNQLLRFRHPDLSTLHFTWAKKKCRPNVPLTLEIKRSAEGQFGLWAHHGKVNPGWIVLKVVDKDPSLPIEARQSVLMGRAIVKTESSLIWQAPRIFFADLSVYSRIALAGAFAMLGILLWGLGFFKMRRKIETPCILMGFVAISCLFYLVFLPPFQAADEADHFRTLTSSEGSIEGLTLANHADFDRIKFHYLESANALPKAQSKQSNWPAHVNHINEYQFRSPIGQWVYGTSSQYFGETLSDLRSIGVVLLMGVLGIFLAFASYLGTSQQLMLLSVLLCAIFQPIIYFSATVSNYSMLSSLSFLYAAVFALILFNPYRALRKPWALIFLYLLLNLLLASSGNGLPHFLSFAAMILVVSFARAPLEQTLAQRLRYWGWFAALGVILSLLMPPSMSVATIDKIGLHVLGQEDSSPLKKFILPSLPILLTLVAFITELGARFVQRKFYLKHFLLWPALGGVLLIFGCLSFYFAFQNGSMPFLTSGLSPEASNGPVAGLKEYALRSSMNYLWSLLGNYPDYWTSQSFWSPFGWLDTNGPENVSRLLNVLSLLGLLSLARTKMARSLPFSGFLPFLLLGFSLVGTAVIAYQAAGLGIDIVGRYLISVQIFTAFLALLSLVNLAARRGYSAEFGLIIAFLCWPIAGMLTILDRYYLALGGSM